MPLSRNVINTAASYRGYKLIIILVESVSSRPKCRKFTF